MVANGEPGYPPLRSHIEDAPPLIVVRGHAHLLEMPAVAVVGARNASLNGRRLALGVVVVEASRRSGSLITARLALEQGREVFAVPGSPLDPRARGPNDLIRQGATLVESAEDVKGALSGMLRRPLGERKPLDFKALSPEPPRPDELDSARAAIKKSLGPAPLLVDEIIRNVHFSPAVVSMVLLELELAGRLEHHPGNQVSLV
jgi:DNA processing protein